MVEPRELSFEVPQGVEQFAERAFERRGLHVTPRPCEGLPHGAIIRNPPRGKLHISGTPLWKLHPARHNNRPLVSDGNV